MNFHGGDIYHLDNEILDFSSNINPLGVPESFKKMLNESMDRFTKYPDIKYVELRKMISNYIGLDSIEYVVPGNGAVEIIYKVIDALDIKEVIIAAPTFSEYRKAAYVKGINFEEIRAYDEARGSLLVDKLVHEIKQNSLYVICNPNNPTGTVTDIKTICSIASALRKANSFLLVDEAFIEFSDNYPNNSMITKLKDYPNVIVIRAATKFFGMPGIRLGYGVSSDIEMMSKIRDRLEPWNVNTAAVIGGLCILKDQEYILKSREWIKKERTFLYGELKLIKGLTVYYSEVNFFLIKIEKNDMNGERLKSLMIDKGILIRTSEGFTYLSPHHIRVAVKDREANIKLLNALKACI